VLDTLRFHADRKYTLYACAVMDTHVHLVLQPLEESPGAIHSLAGITHSIKSYSANRIQKLYGKQGRVWLDENYDCVFRDDKEYLETLSYVVTNPVKAGLTGTPDEYKWLYYRGQ